MKTAVRETSRAAYEKLDINRQQRLIMEALWDMGEGCIADVAAYLKWERSTVSARLNELYGMGKIDETGKRPSKRTGVSGMHYRPLGENRPEEGLF